MKKIVALLLFSMSIAGIKAQTASTDSLKTFLKKEKQDTTRVLLLEKLNQIYSISKPDSALIMALEGLHHRLEKWITKIMVEKNKKIRLEAARKTIANLEPALAEATAGKTEQTI